ncbi:Uncharacterised protein [Mannheimia haemolytica]|nr:Uncharacterised protein [Mannheimia haemolytica]
MASRVAVTKRGSRIGIATIEDRSGEIGHYPFLGSLRKFRAFDATRPKLLWQQVRYSLMISAVD